VVFLGTVCLAKKLLSPLLPLIESFDVDVLNAFIWGQYEHDQVQGAFYNQSGEKKDNEREEELSPPGQYSSCREVHYILRRIIYYSELL
jgi:hypothetical protein